VELVKGPLLAVRFALELGALAALGYWGFQTTENTAFELLLGVGAPLAAAAFWGLFVSPKARVRHPALKLLGEVVVFGAATIALWTAGQTTLAIAFAVVAVVDTLLVYALDA
jgi:Protein of unknown function (DUF2568)